MKWIPDPVRIHDTRIVRFAEWLVDQGRAGLTDVTDYRELHAWSVAAPGEFWCAVAEFFDVEWAAPPREALAERRMPGAVWFPGGKLNFGRHLLRSGRDDQAAVILVAENGDRTVLTYAELRIQAGAVAGRLRALGVEPGDRVAAYLPNCVEGVVAFVATAMVGAVWAQTGLDYAAPSAAERMAQLNPKVLIAGTGYRFGGKVHDRRAAARELRELLPGLQHTITAETAGVADSSYGVERAVPVGTAAVGDSSSGLEAAVPVRTAGVADRSSGQEGAVAAEPWRLSDGSSSSWVEALAATPVREALAVDFDHPLWVLFTSGTTGKPKGIVHGHGGVLLEQLVSPGLHMDLRGDDTFFWYTTPNWMMWNAQICGLLHGSTIVLYDGKPTFPGPDALWRVVADHDVTVFGTSPGYLEASQRAGLKPDIPSVRLVGVTGSVLPATANEWFRENVSDTVQLGSMSGGTDICGVFVASAPTTAVYDGEISAAALGASVEVWDADGGQAPDGTPGEMVITEPMPSMPLYFWDDPDGRKLRDTYFDVFPGVWRHGDLIERTPRGGYVILGRSDATINRHGVRLGSAEIYAAIGDLPNVADALLVGVEQPDGGYWMPLFVVPAGAVEPAAVKRVIAERTSPRHVPDDVILVPSLPHTRTGKRLEVPVKRILQGADPERVIDRGAVDDAGALDTLIAAARAGRSQP
ncbi:AMP-binding protein [Paractinoplanes hotanensis]|uniref:AMP-binding protein n=1 Tax=Paractinoplanes hotanensis TaxID=2906497 RepID=A0ABT0XYG7_9ACTN|nr:AMP-binding protein [Actinoplanes hotanensis]MCM4078832.1 AMP-binding protein [Actinoplanes hotanensis]